MCVEICRVTATQLALLESTDFDAESAHVIPKFHLMAQVYASRTMKAARLTMVKID